MATNNPGRWRRRTYIVNRAFQWKFAGTVALMVFLLSTTMSAILYGALHEQARLRLIHPESYIANVTTVVVVSGVTFATLTSVAVLLWGIVTTHRICGPLWLMRGYFRELAEGRLPNLRPLRKKDEFQDFYADFREAVDTLKAGRRAQLTALSEALSLAKSAGDADENTCRRALDSVSSRLHTLRREIAEAVGEANDEMSGANATHDRQPEIAVTAG